MVNKLAKSMIKLREIRESDKKYFAKWWRDKDLLKATSGILRRITDQEVDKYFGEILGNKTDKQYVISVGGKTIGHLSLTRRRNDYWELQIVIGEKSEQSRGYGTKAINQLLRKAYKLGAKMIYLEVRPDNLKAIEAYRNCGFREIGIKKHPKNKYLPQTLKMVLRTIVKNQKIS